MVKYNSAKSAAILPNCGQGNWGSKRLDNWPQVSQPQRGSAMIQVNLTQFQLIHGFNGKFRDVNFPPSDSLHLLAGRRILF